ncbi:bifunctional nuclease family protein [Cutibacterium sp.]|uniref:bifunctional nuclease family protein n=1 Tax=Cutibacterium sp. TaxID=1912221 RepID=UPI0026DD528A|nr:bifunctional nuclease family protein [Cutibacterium sp.]MDO4411899.1 bifunctional nuclease family protein [Cutibacterium sp.]
MVLLEVAEIRTEPVSGAAVLLLREVEGRRHLALWIAEPEKLAITDALEEKEPIRPYTHDLLARVIAVLCEEEPQCIITKVEDGIWYGELVLGEMRIDARPSDLVALALRLPVPIWCTDEVISSAGILLDAGPEDAVEEFRHFLDEVSPDDFGPGPSTSG